MKSQFDNIYTRITEALEDYDLEDYGEEVVNTVKSIGKLDSQSASVKLMDLYNKNNEVFVELVKLVAEVLSNGQSEPQSTTRKSYDRETADLIKSIGELQPDAAANKLTELKQNNPEAFEKIAGMLAVRKPHGPNGIAELAKNSKRFYINTSF